jgi:hypothetical protein
LEQGGTCPGISLPLEDRPLPPSSYLFFDSPFYHRTRRYLHLFVDTMAPDHTKKTYTLASGDKMPAIGLGTWQSPNNATAAAVEAAIRAGYRYIDTALAYGNEGEVGEGVRAAGVPREQLWITTKLDNSWHKRVAEGIDSSLKSLGTDYVDLYLMHWPSSTRPDDLKKAYDDWNFIDTWRELEKLVDTGKVRNIGVSNFGITNLEKLLNDPSCKVCVHLGIMRSPGAGGDENRKQKERERSLKIITTTKRITDAKE